MRPFQETSMSTSVEIKCNSTKWLCTVLCTIWCNRNGSTMPWWYKVLVQSNFVTKTLSYKPHFQCKVLCTKHTFDDRKCRDAVSINKNPSVVSSFCLVHQHKLIQKQDVPWATSCWSKTTYSTPNEVQVDWWYFSVAVGRSGKQRSPHSPLWWIRTVLCAGSGAFEQERGAGNKHSDLPMTFREIVEILFEERWSRCQCIRKRARWWRWAQLVHINVRFAWRDSGLQCQEGDNGYTHKNEGSWISCWRSNWWQDNPFVQLSSKKPWNPPPEACGTYTFSIDRMWFLPLLSRTDSTSATEGLSPKTFKIAHIVSAVVALLTRAWSVSMSLALRHTMMHSPIKSMLCMICTKIHHAA